MSQTCEECQEGKIAIWKCPTCEQHLCDECNVKLHKKGRRINHKRIQLERPPDPIVSFKKGGGSRAAPPSAGKVCEECETNPATWRCNECEESMCDDCNAKVHKHGKRKTHIRTPLGRGSGLPPPIPGGDGAPPPLPVGGSGDGGSGRKCEECDVGDAVVECPQCEQALCSECDGKFHKSGRRALHKRTPLASSAPSSSPPPPIPGDSGPPPPIPGDSGPPPPIPGDSGASTSEDRMCEECDEEPAVKECKDCEQVFCLGCDATMHKSGRRKFHGRTSLAKAPKPSSASKKRIWRPAVAAATPPQFVPPVGGQKSLKTKGPSSFELNRLTYADLLTAAKKLGMVTELEKIGAEALKKN